MVCDDCSTNKEILFRTKEGRYMCLKCKLRNEKAKEKKKVMVFVPDSLAGSNDYIIRMKLRNEKGEEWIDEMYHMTLTDFEVVYGNISEEIIWLTIRRNNRAII